jgi:dipeptidyl aminopeptidase/acylaminoacyl peptidase
MSQTLLRATALAAAVGAAAIGAAQPSGPGIDDLLNLTRVGGPAVAPDGRSVAFTVRETNWDDNEFETEIWIGGLTGTARPLTSGRKSSMQPAWSPDGHWIAFVSDREGRRQLYRIHTQGGEAEPLTSGEEAVNGFAWSPDGATIAYTMTDAVPDRLKEREKLYGDLRFEDQDRRMTHLHLLTLAASGAARTRRITSGDFVVGAFDWSPDGRSIAFDHRVSSDPADGDSANISIVDVASSVVRPLVTQAGPDASPRWSPDGTRIAFVTSMAKPFFFYQNSVIAVTPAAGGSIESLTDGFDEDPGLLRWTPQGIYFAASQRTWAYLFQLDPATKHIVRHAVADAWTGTGFSLTPNGQSVAFIGSTAVDFPDVYLATVSSAGVKPGAATRTGVLAATRVSRTADQIAAWPKHTREVIRWKSQDGAEIEGVLHRPADFAVGRRYPLLVVIHGGPTGISRPVPYTNYVGYYPIDLWLAKGAIVLEPNYRGSAGYGEKFRALNVRNLGIGDAWDVISGIDHLVAAGLVDRDRVGAMGWSQGGYISAFLTTRHSDRFKAVSVGAGISNWMTYYVNTDIHPFTRQYLKATPWDDPKIYADTSPMTYIKNAKTPTLIQHGDQDQRVPAPNAFELYQGLRDQNVPVELVLFKGFAHPLNKPKANRAAMQQNLDWFDKYLWGTTATNR